MKKSSTKSLLIVQLCIVFTLLFSLNISAQNTKNENTKPALNFSLDVNDSDGVIHMEEFIQAFVDIENNSEITTPVEIHWRISTDSHHPLFDVIIPQKIGAKKKLKSYCPPYQFQKPGFYQITAEVKTRKEIIYRDKITIGVDPEKISAPLDAQPDFDNFWEESLNSLKSIDPEYNIIPIKREGNTKTNLFKVEIKSLGGLTVRGWLEIPKKPGKYPALLRVPGYTENLTPVDKYNDLIVFSFNTRDHGESDNSGKRGWDMWVRGLENKDDFFYRNIILDCFQALDYLCSRPDVDTKRIAVWGGSQGGGLSFTTAALDKRISLCIADIPFLCEYPLYFEISHWNEIDAWFDKNPDQTWESMFQTLSYFDTKNMAHKITCPVYMGIGLQDDVCPPATSFVTYNYLSCKKEFSIYKYEKHSQPDSHYENRFLKIREIFKMD